MTAWAGEIETARQLYDSGKFVEATPLLEKLVRERPDDGVLRHQLGVCLQMGGEERAGVDARAAAIPLLEKELAGHPTITLLYYLAGDYQMRGDAEKSKEVVEQTARLFSDGKLVPGGAGESYQLAAVLERAGKGEESRKLLVESLRGFRAEPNPNRRYMSDILVRLGNAEFEKGNADQALASFVEAQQIDPTNPGGFYVHGVVMDSQGKLAEARRDYERALTIEPGHFYARYNLANLLARQGDVAGAMAGFEAALVTEPSGADLLRTYLALAKLCEVGGLFRKAAGYYEKVGRIQPDAGVELQARYATAQALRQEGDLDGALVTLRELASHAPDSAPLRAEIAELLLQKKDFAAAVSELLSALALAPEEGRLYLALGRAYVAQGKTDDARGAFQKAKAMAATAAEADSELAALAKGTP